ncbi:MAG: hypothetical protein ACI4KM_00260 [Oscillospiraceae bacterium]
MLVHVCASYKRSPVGFQPGSFLWQKKTSNNYSLSDCKGSKLLYQLFEQGFISGIKGKLPNKNKYIFLIKDVEYSYENHVEFGRDVYVNLIFEFDNADEYSLFVAGYQSIDSSLSSKMIADFVVPDNTNKQYALHINGDLFDGFVEKVLKNSQPKTCVDDTLEVYTISANTRYDQQLNNLLGVDFEKEGYVYVYPPKKKHILNRHWNQAAKESPICSKSSSIKQLLSKYKMQLLAIGGILSFFALLLLLIFMIIPKLH